MSNFYIDNNLLWLAVHKPYQSISSRYSKMSIGWHPLTSELIHWTFTRLLQVYEHISVVVYIARKKLWVDGSKTLSAYFQ